MTAPRLDSDLRRAVVRWIADDPHEGDRAELQQLLAAAMATNPVAVQELSERMQPLAFGTAGLRGPLRAGPGGLNLATARRTAAGLAAYLRQTSAAGPVVIGYDARRRSDEFARDVAGVFAAANFTVYLAPQALPTPMTAFAVKKMNAAAGVQITASHNPPDDNGIKVYLAGGAQLVPPEDAAVEAAIAAAPPGRTIDASGSPIPWPDSLVRDYLAAASAVGGPLTAPPIKIAATALHGVGGQPLVQALHDAGFADVVVVAQQAVPDGRFPTVAFPNPEEPGATDLLLALAESSDADLAIANDPDADRVAFGVRFPAGWRMLSGDETGALLGDAILARLDRTIHPDPLVATTIVSSTLLADIARAHGARFAETLTGFKWIVRAGDGRATGLVYGYEEALGHCVDPDVVRDKDGISAAVLAAKLAAELKAAGSDLPEALNVLARAHGLRVTSQLSVRVTDLEVIAGAMRRLRSEPPATLLGDDIVEHRDLLPATDGLLFRTTRLRVVIRPSGTEPKLKCYLELSSPVDESTDLPDARERAQADLVAAKAELADRLGVAS